MSEKICGALFNILGDIEGLTILDAFAGSGAISFEAISRGASSSLAIDADRAAAKTITENSQKLGISKQVRVVQASVSAWMQTNLNASFDIVIADPPYDDMQLSVIEKLIAYVKPSGLLVLSWPGSQEAPDLSPLQKVEQRSYKDAQLIFYRVA
jgi:16S rRNA (guanine(966)-N(2))-methyltransferase RsmD